MCVCVFVFGCVCLGVCVCVSVCLLSHDVLVRGNVHAKCAHTPMYQHALFYIFYTLTLLGLDLAGAYRRAHAFLLVSMHAGFSAHAHVCIHPLACFCRSDCRWL